MNKMTKIKYLILALMMGSLFACSPENTQKPAPIALTATTEDYLDGMILLDYPGPKGQIQYKIGESNFFCDTVGFFSIYLNPEQDRKVIAAYVQDMGQADWDQPVGHWIDAKDAYYVIGSDKRGAMGPTFIPFLHKEDALKFIEKHQGKLYTFEQITPDMTVLDGGVIKDKMM